MANVSDEPTKLEMLEAVAKVFRDRTMMNNLHYSGMYIEIERPVVRATLVNNDLDITYPRSPRVFVGSHPTAQQEIYVAYGNSIRVTMTYRQATELAYVLPELKWENI